MEETTLITETFRLFTVEKQLTPAFKKIIVSFYGKQCSLQAFPLRPQHSGIEIPHWQSGEMERLVFSKTYISLSLTLIRNKLPTTVFPKQSNIFLFICRPMYRVCYDSWFWCQVRMPPIRSAPLPTHNSQLSQYRHFSQTCLSWGGRETAI